MYRSQVQSVCATADELIATATPEQAFAGWIRALAGYLVTKRGLSGSLIAGLGKDSELMSGCWMAMRDAAERLLDHAQQAGVLRSDITPHDVLRLVHGIVVSTEQAPEDTDRLLSIMFDGLRPREEAEQPCSAESLDRGGRFSYGVLSTIVVRVDTFATLRICCSKSSSAPERRPGP